MKFIIGDSIYLITILLLLGYIAYRA